jgi:hypothetical protein
MSTKISFSLVAAKTRSLAALVVSLVLLLPLSLTGQAHAATTCTSTPGHYCVALGSPAEMLLTTITNGFEHCTVTWTINWGDGTAPDTVQLPPVSQTSPSHTYQALGIYTETAAAFVDPSSDPGCFQIPGGWNRQIVWEVVEPLTARIAPVAPVVRGGHAFLDASASAGPVQITWYRWDFTPEGDCPAGLTLANPSVTVTAPTLDIVVLCDLLVKLTVHDLYGAVAEQTTHIPVDPRTTGGWTPTKVRLVPQGSSADPRTPKDDFLWGQKATMARTVSACRLDSQNLNLCPPTDGLGTLEGTAFNVTDVYDLGGPFHGFWFMLQNNVYVKQIGLFNPNLFQSSTITHPDPDRPGKQVNWFTFNQRHHRPVDAFIAAVRMHERWGKNGSAANPNSGHVGALACYLRKDQTHHNPAVVLEALVGQQKAEVVSHANDSLRRIESELTAASNDPLPIIWSGNLSEWNPAKHSWVLSSSFQVGAGNQAPSC